MLNCTLCPLVFDLTKALKMYWSWKYADLVLHIPILLYVIRILLYINLVVYLRILLYIYQSCCIYTDLVVNIYINLVVYIRILLYIYQSCCISTDLVVYIYISIMLFCPFLTSTPDLTCDFEAKHSLAPRLRLMQMLAVCKLSPRAMWLDTANSRTTYTISRGSIYWRNNP